VVALLGASGATVVLPAIVHDAQEFLMLDILMLALGLGFFILTVGYAYACERL
jgi:hypothetical protein